MEKYTFPAIFDPDEEGRGYTVTFPDLPGCITEGDTLEEARAMAREALELYLWDMEQHNEAIPSPTSPEKVSPPPGAFVTFVDAWMDLVRDEMENRAVKKTLTIPKWLNDAAEKEGINFSHLLQHALKQRIGIRQKKAE